VKPYSFLASQLHLPPRISQTTADARGPEDSATVDMRWLFLRWEGHRLILPPEALANALMIPAMKASRTPHMETADELGLANDEKAQAILSDWWSWPVRLPRVKHVTTLSATRSNRVGLAFRLGVDSFHSLFFADPSPEVLMMVGGFDAPLDRGDILSAMAASTREVAGNLGIDWMMIRTNLRRHRLLRSASWDDTQGGTLAAVGMVASAYFGTLVLSSAIPRGRLYPNGVHPLLDSRWGSSFLALHHFGDHQTRLGKLREIIGLPKARELFMRHVRVCWQSPTVQGNCGNCTKCMLLRLSLMRLGEQQVPDTMPPLEDDPVALIERWQPLRHRGSIDYRRELLGFPDFAINDALMRYIERSEPAIAAREQS